jgi:hypothetical protein
MKHLLRIFELTKNEQRVVLIVLVVLIAIAFIRYERRVHSLTYGWSSPTPTPSLGE